MGRARSIELSIVLAVLLALSVGGVVLPGGVQAVAADQGVVWAWGYNNYGQLGNGANMVNSLTPAQTVNLSGVTKVRAGTNFSVALRDDGTVWTWGVNHLGQLGISSASETCGAGDTLLPCSRTPLQVGGLSGVVTVAAGDRHALALKRDGTVWAWGYNPYGQLGATSQETCEIANTNLPCSRTPLQVAGLSGVTAVGAGSRHSLAIKSDGTVWAWGLNSFGQLGTESNDTCSGAPCSATPIQVGGLSGGTALAAGHDYSLAITSDGTVWGWGRNEAGQLGTGATTNADTPAQVAGLTGVKEVAAGQDHSLALKNDGTVWAWGSNEFGDLGTGPTNNMSTPVLVAGLSDVVAVAAGEDHSLAAKADGTLWAWGLNNIGQLGTASRDTCGASAAVCSTTPQVVSGVGRVSAVAVGGRHSLAVANIGAPGPPNAGGAPALPASGGGGRSTDRGSLSRLAPLLMLGLVAVLGASVMLVRYRSR